MIAVDTNVLLRLFVADNNAEQLTAARELVRDQAPVFVNPVVLAEFAWTLKTTYKLSRAAIVDRLSRIIGAPEFRLVYPEIVTHALRHFEAGAADIADYLIGEMNLAFGSDTTLTFDKVAARESAFQLLQR